MTYKKILDDKFLNLIGEKISGLGVIAFKDGREVYANFSGFRNIKKKIARNS